LADTFSLPAPALMVRASAAAPASAAAVAQPSAVAGPAEVAAVRASAAEALPDGPPVAAARASQPAAQALAA
jgi:hypothetical protein